MITNMRSRLELLFAQQVKDARLPEPERDYRFHPTRKWAFDFAWPRVRRDDGVVITYDAIAVEVEGGTFVAGRHSRGRGYEEDCEKYAEALILGWRVLRVTTDMVSDGRAIALLRRLFGFPNPDLAHRVGLYVERHNSALTQAKCSCGWKSEWVSSNERERLVEAHWSENRTSAQPEDK
jgi:hypothetical protein